MTMYNMKRVHFFRERDKLIIVETGFVSNYGGMLFHHQENQKRVKIKSIEDTKKYHLYYHHHRDHKDLSNHGHLPVGRPYQNTLEQKGSHFWQKQEIPFCARERTELMEPTNKRQGNKESTNSRNVDGGPLSVVQYICSCSLPDKILFNGKEQLKLNQPKSIWPFHFLFYK